MYIQLSGDDVGKMRNLNPCRNEVSEHHWAPYHGRLDAVAFTNEIDANNRALGFWC